MVIMRFFRKFLVILVLFCLIMMSGELVLAMNIRFEIEQLSESEKNTYIDRHNKGISKLNFEPGKKQLYALM